MLIRIYQNSLELKRTTVDDVDFGSFFSHLWSRGAIPTSAISVVYFPCLFLKLASSNAFISSWTQGCFLAWHTSWNSGLAISVTKLLEYAEDGISRTTPRRQDTSAGDRWRVRCERFVLKVQRREVLVVVLESALDREKTNSTWVATEIYLVERINIVRTF